MVGLSYTTARLSRVHLLFFVALPFDQAHSGGEWWVYVYPEKNMWYVIPKARRKIWREYTRVISAFPQVACRPPLLHATHQHMNSP